MEPVAILILAVLWLPIWVVRKELRARSSPDYWRRWGAIVLQPQALQERDGVIGSYMGTEIFAHVRFSDCDYHFDHVAPSRERDFIEGGELFLEPGLVYHMDEPLTSLKSG